MAIAKVSKKVIKVMISNKKKMKGIPKEMKS